MSALAPSSSTAGRVARRRACRKTPGFEGVKLKTHSQLSPGSTMPLLTEHQNNCPSSETAELEVFPRAFFQVQLRTVLPVLVKLIFALVDSPRRHSNSTRGVLMVTFGCSGELWRRSITGVVLFKSSSSIVSTNPGVESLVEPSSTANRSVPWIYRSLRSASCTEAVFLPGFSHEGFSSEIRLERARTLLASSCESLQDLRTLGSIFCMFLTTVCWFCNESEILQYRPEKAFPTAT
mmetsp:Transcript_35100/g.68922  ORF Transcript_35100/g.68922 Transcript_35100/m.68922 type:complete len:236 (-) Transcript_35100:1029-1736(-)